LRNVAESFGVPTALRDLDAFNAGGDQTHTNKNLARRSISSFLILLRIAEQNRCALYAECGSLNYALATRLPSAAIRKMPQGTPNSSGISHEPPSGTKEG
jgi:hypothetical protein